MTSSGSKVLSQDSASLPSYWHARDYLHWIELNTQGSTTRTSASSATTKWSPLTFFSLFVLSLQVSMRRSWNPWHLQTFQDLGMQSSTPLRRQTTHLLSATRRSSPRSWLQYITYGGSETKEGFQLPTSP